MKIVTIVEDDPIFGVKYGTVEIPDTVLETNRLDTQRATFGQSMQTKEIINRHRLRNFIKSK